MRNKGGAFIELCAGVATIFLLGTSLFYMATLPAQATKEKTVLTSDFGENYEALKHEKKYLEEYMQVLETEKDGTKWMAHKEAPDDDKMMDFAAYVSQTPDRTSGRLLLEFARSDDFKVDRMNVAMEEVGQEVSLKDVKRRTTQPEDGIVKETIELDIGRNLALLKQVTKSEKVVIRLFVDGREGETEVDGQLSSAQIRNLDRTLRLYEVYREMRAIEEARRQA